VKCRCDRRIPRSHHGRNSTSPQFGSSDGASHVFGAYKYIPTTRGGSYCHPPAPANGIHPCLPWVQSIPAAFWRRLFSAARRGKSDRKRKPPRLSGTSPHLLLSMGKKSKEVAPAQAPDAAPKPSLFASASENFDPTVASLFASSVSTMGEQSLVIRRGADHVSTI
jgi:hypothetical protein